jgi:hypothetical protein
MKIAGSFALAPTTQLMEISLLKRNCSQEELFGTYAAAGDHNYLSAVGVEGVSKAAKSQQSKAAKTAAKSSKSVFVTSTSSTSGSMTSTSGTMASTSGTTTSVCGSFSCSYIGDPSCCPGYTCGNSGFGFGCRSI